MSAGLADHEPEPTRTPATLRRGDRVRALVTRSNAELAASVRLALGPFSRLRGLIGRPLPPGAALLLRPCRAVHTCLMGYAIDVVFLDDDGRVVALQEAMRPWRFSPYHERALCALELPAGTAAAHALGPGDRVAFARVE